MVSFMTRSLMVVCIKVKFNNHTGHVVTPSTVSVSVRSQTEVKHLKNLNVSFKQDPGV